MSEIIVFYKDKAKFATVAKIATVKIEGITI